MSKLQRYIRMKIKEQISSTRKLFQKYFYKSDHLLALLRNFAQ